MMLIDSLFFYVLAGCKERADKEAGPAQGRLVAAALPRGRGGMGGGSSKGGGGLRDDAPPPPPPPAADPAKKEKEFGKMQKRIGLCVCVGGWVVGGGLGGWFEWLGCVGKWLCSVV